MRIVLGSESVIKLEAVRRAFPEADVNGLSCESGVPPQPVGKEETERGAFNRAHAAWMTRNSHLDPPVLCIGIENGMYQRDSDGVWVDAAIAVILEKKPDSGEEDGFVRSSEWSEELEIPPDFEKGPFGEWSYLKDPHVVVTNGKKPRADFLVETLLLWRERQGWLKH